MNRLYRIALAISVIGLLSLSIGGTAQYGSSGYTTPTATETVAKAAATETPVGTNDTNISETTTPTTTTSISATTTPAETVSVGTTTVPVETTAKSPGFDGLVGIIVLVSALYILRKR